MELRSLIAPAKRASGLSCRNCSKLMCEYDLDTADRSGVWVCDKFPGYAADKSFPFRRDMPCFELSFWFSVFAQNLRENDEADCEDALERFSQTIGRVGPGDSIHGRLVGPGMTSDN